MAVSFGVVYPLLAIYEVAELIGLSGLEVHCDGKGTGFGAFHGVCALVPAIEVANEGNRLGAGNEVFFCLKGNLGYVLAF